MAFFSLKKPKQTQFVDRFMFLIVLDSVCELVHASRLTKQIIGRGFSADEAVKLSCQNVYLSTHNDADTKEVIFANQSFSQRIIKIATLKYQS